MKHKRQAVNGSVNKDAASKVSDTIRQIIRGTKEKREKKDKEIAEAALISRENSHGSSAGVTNIMLPASAAAATVRLEVERRALDQPAEPLGIANLRWRGAGSLRAGRAGE